MITYPVNITKVLEGKWLCKGYFENDTKELNPESFYLDFSKNIVSCLPKGTKLWPKVCGFEPIGSKNGGYFYREDGYFFRIKYLNEKSINLELSMKVNDHGDINKYIFQLEKEIE